MRYRPDTRTWHGSPTDLADLARCDHLVQRKREHARETAEGRIEPIVASGLAVEKGREFEASWVAQRRAQVEAAGGRFIDVRAIAGRDPIQQRTVLEQAMRDGIELVAQAPLRSGSIFGFADLLERTEDAPGPGGTLQTLHRYEPTEIKYGRSVRVEYVLQACAYADALEPLQGELPVLMRLVTGDGAQAELRVDEHVEYYRAARTRLDAALTRDLDAQLAHVPDPVAHCGSCDFAATCDARRLAADHLGLVAGIHTDQRAKLRAVDITTLTELATSQLERVPGIGHRTWPRLRRQALLQLLSRTRSEDDAAIAFRDPVDDQQPEGRGFALLPHPDAADMHFDFEGYPFHESGALEYLWGWTSLDTSGNARFDYLWADNPAEEAQAFTAFLDEVHARLERSPGMHVYHYAPYEITALRRLARQYHHEQPRLDALLRAGVFVDLYAVVRQAMQIGTSSYSIKSLEPLYGIDRTGDELADGGASIDVFERWLTEHDEHVRTTILDYNRVDCESTLALRDWLLVQRDLASAAGIIWPSANERPQHDPDVANDDDEDGESEAEPHPSRVLTERLEQVADDAARPDDVRFVARLLSAMPGWQRRIDREFWGDLYARRHDRDAEDLAHEPASLGGLELLDEQIPPRSRPGTFVRRYRFPAQITLVSAGDAAIDPIQVARIGVVDAVDMDAGIVAIRSTQKHHDSLAQRGQSAVAHAVIGRHEITMFTLQDAAARVAQHLLDALDAGADPFNPQRPGAAALSILARHQTRVTDGDGPEALEQDPDPDALAELVRRARGSHVIVQGPPGTGKTWTSARLIAALVRAGLRVGISSNSHDAVINVLRGIDEHRAEAAADGSAAAAFDVAYTLRTGERQPGSLGFGEGWIRRGSSAATAELVSSGEVQVLAGTAWQLSRGVELDVVLVDEAGQVSLLHAMAMASSARTVVLVGDPQQLPQPASVQHPWGCGASALEHLFEGAAVLGPERAVLLPETRRMHPDVCSFVSDTYYLGALQPHPSTALQRLIAPGTPLPSAGIHLLQVAHHGNRSSAPEEVDAIAQLVQTLLAGARVVPHPDQPERALAAHDILVVAPYNAQRRLLREALPQDVEVGTVDRFQGREAPVAILSMTASSRDELPRGLEFLLDPHRLNVGISRARALAVVVASPTLLATSAANVSELRLLNDLARFARQASTSIAYVPPTACNPR